MPRVGLLRSIAVPAIAPPTAPSTPPKTALPAVPPIAAPATAPPTPPTPPPIRVPLLTPRRVFLEIDLADRDDPPGFAAIAARRRRLDARLHAVIAGAEGGRQRQRRHQGEKPFAEHVTPSGSRGTGGTLAGYCNVP